MKKILIIFMFFTLFKFAFSQDRIHWGTTDTPLNGLTITWNSIQPHDSIRWGYSDIFEKGVFADSSRDGLNSNEFWHDFTFPIVTPSSFIYYSIKSNGKWSAIKTFKTASDPNFNNITFIAGGDSRNDDLNNPHFKYWGECADSLAPIKADFHIFLGDHVDIGKHVNYGDEKVWWGEWFDEGKKFLESHLLYHTPGNNEYANTGSIGSQIYLNQFVLPDSEKWYSFEYGDAFFLCLYSETGSSDFERQFPWMKEELENTDKKWKIVYFHRPFYSSKDDHLESLFDTWWKAFDDNGVDVVLNGHTHFYLRTKPINRNVNTTTAVEKYGSAFDEGRMEVIAGSYGAPLKTATYDGNWYVENNQLTYNYTKITIQDSLLLFRAYNMNSDLIDSVRLLKNDIGSSINDDNIKRNVIPEQFYLNNYPNPFNPTTKINFGLPNVSNTILEVYNLLGQRLQTIVNEKLSAGNYSFKFDAGNLPSGVYIYRLMTNNCISSKKMILMK